MLRKFILFLVLLIIVLACGLPFLDGMWLNKHYLRMIELANQNFHHKITIINYSRGWFTSRVSLKIEPNPADVPLRFQRFSNSPIYIDQVITHGPLVFDPAPKIAAGKIISNMRIEDFNTFLGLPADRVFMTANGISYFDQTYTTTFVIPAITKTFPNQVIMNWKGLTGHSSLSVKENRIDRVSYDANIGEFSVDMPNKMYGLKTGPYLVESGAQTSQMQGLWNTYHKSSLSSLNFSMFGKEMVALNSFQFLLKTNVANNNMYNIVMNFSGDKLILSLPATYVIQPMSLNVSLDNLNATQIDEWMKTPRQERGDQFLNSAAKIINADTRAKVDLSINTNNGRVFVTGEAHWLANDLPTTTDAIDDKANYQVDIRVSQSLLNQVVSIIDKNNTGPFAQPNQAPPPGPTMRMQIDNLISAGYLTPDKDDYTSTIVGGGGKVTINGKPFPIPTMPGVGVPVIPGAQPMQPAAPLSRPTTVPGPDANAPTSFTSPAPQTPQASPTPSQPASTVGSPQNPAPGQPMMQTSPPTQAPLGSQSMPMPQPAPMQPAAPSPAGEGMQLPSSN